MLVLALFLFVFAFLYSVLGEPLSAAQNASASIVPNGSYAAQGQTYTLQTWNNLPLIAVIAGFVFIVARAAWEARV